MTAAPNSEGHTPAPPGVIALTAEQSGGLLSKAERIASLGAWSFDHATQVPSFTPGMVDLIGVPDSQSSFDYLNPHSHAPAMLAWLEHVSDPTSMTFSEERRQPLPDGQIRIYRILAETTRDAHGRPLISTGTVADVTAAAVARTALVTTSSVARVLIEAGDVPTVLAAFTDTIVTSGGYRYCAYGQPGRATPQRIETVAFHGSDRWISEEVDRNATLAWQQDRTIALKSGTESVVAPEAMFIPVHVHGRPHGILSVWADELTLLNGDQTRLLPLLASSLAVGLGRLLRKEQVRTAFAASIAMLVDAEAIDPATLESFQTLLDVTSLANQ